MHKASEEKRPEHVFDTRNIGYVTQVTDNRSIRSVVAVCSHPDDADQVVEALSTLEALSRFADENENLMSAFNYTGSDAVFRLSSLLRQIVEVETAIAELESSCGIMESSGTLSERVRNLNGQLQENFVEHLFSTTHARANGGQRV